MPRVREVDVTTGEETTRQRTAAEQAQRDRDAAAGRDLQAAADARRGAVLDARSKAEAARAHAQIPPPVKAALDALVAYLDHVAPPPAPEPEEPATP